MDVILALADEYLLDRVWARLVPGTHALLHLPTQSHALSKNASIIAPLSSWSIFQPPAIASAWPRDHFTRQILSLTVITLIGICVLYFLFASLSFYFIFNHDMMRHPRFLPNQVRLEIICSLWAFPGMTLLTLPFFLSEVRGHTRLYDKVEDYGWPYLIASVPIFLLFTDYCIYWIHRWLHVPFLYKRLHKPHHKWIIPTPYASHAFHAVDGWAQSVPYHLFIYIFPLQRHLYLALFVFVNFWSILIHDSDMVTDHPLEKVINGPSHHTLHHIYFTCNYGQYFTWADRAGGSYRQPQKELDPLLEVKMLKKAD
ncbi:fatty acid hydroxylase [Sistotremastrum niveocremeum HHB9708]|uniref:Fatty acid hydroxylase n=1 Tax=Sistotremastrum niveocremeum HHB9708 TaxID=1314777 RepID=A0A164TWW5_9AGAM|nr:fatty acid hydroxylase [Sistotremastrum niveocremeum HHB9708]